MFRVKTFSFLSIVSLIVVSLLFPVFSLKASTTVAPTLIEANLIADGRFKAQVTGLTWGNTEVAVYLNNEYWGEAIIQDTGQTVRSFYFNTDEVLPAGEHQITAIARDRTFLVQSDFSNSLALKINNPPSPTLIAPNENTVMAKTRPVITGLTKNATLVHVWIDNIYNGKTDIVNHESGTANFAYQPFLNLSVGEHAVAIVAEDEYGRKSSRSKKLQFRVEELLPAPILLDPVATGENARPLITGLAKNDFKIRVFIDQILNGEFLVDNHESGTANFAYQPFLPLLPGSHLVYVTALDNRGKESQWSQFISLNIPRPPAISDLAAAEGEEPVVLGIEKEITAREDAPAEAQVEIITPSTGDAVVEDVKPGTDVSEFLAVPEAEEEKTGLINEAKERLGKLRLNIVIFILFMIAVILWIFWVNRELIKERRETEEGNKKTKDKDQDTLKL